eukprot:CAMPEP_0184366104 /NCGR_PEP_ID=MMETSP1089-20130417/152102_1 /TAXON_ID=38269 ORGANISM="Gloeochaete wittrockiana, Strain SAG46.84" /NCGR_SAMPLE_ID=MMETSP1089 /ASSEMBLY_ACC=CAM_ASM_000445 /LENGTH=77 /DNA_ID=CAMNT_0026707573 /DNA_START=46 /DNA_END=276 /DNA_ORIENTATION=+
MEEEGEVDLDEDSDYAAIEYSFSSSSSLISPSNAKTLPALQHSLSPEARSSDQRQHRKGGQPSPIPAELNLRGRPTQ